MSAADVPVSSGSRTVGLREVNQQAGRVYREVESSGVPVTVTDHGRPIAQIVPIRHDESWYERMVREGKGPSGRGGLCEWGRQRRRCGAEDISHPPSVTVRANFFGISGAQ